MDFEVTAMKTTYDANIFTYCQWRDDLTMQQSPFCHVDNLIFCCLSYLNWDGIAEGFTAAESISLRDAARLWEHRPTAEQKVRVETDRDLLRQTAASRRFGEVRLFRYAEQFSETQQQQFSATAFLLDSDTVYVAFRGTDNTLTGWREDFNLSFLVFRRGLCRPAVLPAVGRPAAERRALRPHPCPDPQNHLLKNSHKIVGIFQTPT